MVAPDPRDELWDKHNVGLAKNASLTSGCWRWWFGNGLPKGLIDDLREMLVSRFPAARVLYGLLANQFAYWRSRTASDSRRLHSTARKQHQILKI